MNDTQQALARSAIRHLMAIYNTAGDRGRIDEALSVFAANGVLDIPGASLAGAAQIHAFLSGVARDGAPDVDLAGSRHHLTTSRIEFNDDGTAGAWTYFFVMRRGMVLQEGTYVDRFTQGDGRWLISHRRVKILWTIQE